MSEKYFVREYTISDQELASIIDGLSILRNVKYDNLRAFSAVSDMGIYIDLIDDYEDQIQNINQTIGSLKSQMISRDWHLKVGE